MLKVVYIQGGIQVTPSLLLKNPKIKMALFVIGGCILAYLLAGSWLNNIRTTEKTIHNQWVSLKQNCERRVQLLPQFVQLIQVYVPQAQDLQQVLTKTFQNVSQYALSEKILTDEGAMQEFIVNQTEVTKALSFMEIQSRNYPVLAQNRQFLMLKMELQSLEQQIEYTVVILNQNINIYNSFLEGIPQNWVNALFLRAKPKQLLQLAAVKKQKQE